jgi:hypothetical protein
MPSTHNVVEVRGLRDFRKDLKQLNDKQLESDLKDVNQSVARLVVDRARARATSSMERRAASTLTASRSGARSAVALGGARFPGALGAEFGAGRDRPRQTARGTVRGWNQFKEWRGSGRTAGYFLHPAIRASEDEIVELYGAGLDKLTAKAFPD